MTSKAVGIYQGNQTLLIPKEQYLEGIAELKNEKAPVNLWVYFGLRESESGNSIYTYGLSEFSKQEMEIVDSNMPLDELLDLMTNITAYVINSNVTFKVGETLGYTEDQKIKISASKGKFVVGETLKLAI